MIDWNKHNNATCVSVKYFDSNGDTISTSWVDRPTQPKTVADAVADHGGKWPFSHGIILMGYSPKHEHYFAFGDGYELVGGEYMVCTHKQFEAYVKEQEGEKWAYELWGDKAYIKISEPDCDGYLVVVTEGDGYNLVKMDDLKPIKPTISTKEYDILAKYAAALNVDPAQFDQYISDNYNSQLKD